MPSQRRTLEFFTALRLLRPSWAGTLLLGIGLDSTGRALALASLAAGAAALFLESDPANLRQATREGCSTFTVTTLDEALRTLKNEIRRSRAITVALSGDPSKWLAESTERGVQPDYMAQPLPCHQTSIAMLEARGARSLAGLGLNPTPNATCLESFLARANAEGWHIVEDAASTLLERRARDASLLAVLNPADPIARLTTQWLRAAPTLFPRALHRTIWTHVADVSPLRS